MKRIVCIGNRFFGNDDVGPRVFDRLRQGDLPADVEIIDGGVAGLNLLPAFDGASRVVLVDAVAGFGPPGSIHELEPSDVADAADEVFDHGSGVPYLLRMLPASCGADVPNVVVLGVETPASEQSIAAAAQRARRAVGLDGLVNLDLSERGVA